MITAFLAASLFAFVGLVLTASDTVTDTTGLSALIGLVIPLLISVIIRTRWKRSAQELAAFAVCIAAAIVLALLKQELTSTTPIEAFGIIYASARATYLAVWKPSDIAPTIERATG